MADTKKLIQQIKNDVREILKTIKAEDRTDASRSLAAVLGVEVVAKEQGIIKIRTKSIPLDEYLHILEEDKLRSIIEELMGEDEHLKHLPAARAKRAIKELIGDGKAIEWIKIRINRYGEEKPEVIPKIMDGMDFVSGVGSKVALHCSLDKYLSQQILRLPAISKNIEVLKSRIIDPEVAYSSQYSVGQGWEARTTAIALSIDASVLGADKSDGLKIFTGNDLKKRDDAIYNVITFVLETLDTLERKAKSKGLEIEKIVKEVLAGRTSPTSLEEIKERVRNVDFEDALRLIHVFKATLKRIDEIGNYTVSRGA